jgi:hypothetical protein
VRWQSRLGTGGSGGGNSSSSSSTDSAGIQPGCVEEVRESPADCSKHLLDSGVLFGLKRTGGEGGVKA